jgi:NAD(P)-dependent dehydrogenase (short-subunit alcohol dehydrogenase family)
MPKTIVITGTATGMGRAAVSKFAVEGNPLRTSSAEAGAIATVYLVGERNGLCQTLGSSRTTGSTTRPARLTSGLSHDRVRSSRSSRL